MRLLRGWCCQEAHGLLPVAQLTRLQHRADTSAAYLPLLLLLSAIALLQSLYGAETLSVPGSYEKVEEGVLPW
jgi:hypothetical protein